jgi:hypothetical protein
MFWFAKTTRRSYFIGCKQTERDANCVSPASKNSEPVPVPSVAFGLYIHLDDKYLGTEAIVPLFLSRESLRVVTVVREGETGEKMLTTVVQFIPLEYCSRNY